MTRSVRLSVGQSVGLSVGLSLMISQKSGKLNSLAPNGALVFISEETHVSPKVLLHIISIYLSIHLSLRLSLSLSLSDTFVCIYESGIFISTRTVMHI